VGKKKCYNCGIVDSIHVRDTHTSKLVSEQGMPDGNGLLMFLIYCRSCGTVNVYKPGWFGNVKFDQFLKYNILLDKIKSGEMKPEMFRIVTPRIQQAMIEDGVLPSDWKIV
jgi:hypothetical protein